MARLSEEEEWERLYGPLGEGGEFASGLFLRLDVEGMSRLYDEHRLMPDDLVIPYQVARARCYALEVRRTFKYAVVSGRGDPALALMIRLREGGGFVERGPWAGKGFVPPGYEYEVRND